MACILFFLLDTTFNSMGNEKEDSEVSDAGGHRSVESIYQKKTQLEHVLLRPDTYIGSTEPVTQVRPEVLCTMEIPQVVR